MSDEAFPMLLSGVLIAFIIGLGFFHLGESQCQQKHDVADCEYDTENVFRPVIKEGN